MSIIDLEQAKQEQTPIDEAQELIKEAISSLSDGDTGAHWDTPVIDAARLIYTKDKPLFYRLRGDIKKANKESQITEWIKAVRGEGSSEDDGKADDLVNAVKEITELFHDPDSNGYACFKQGSHRETWPLGSKGFNDWLGYLAYNKLGFVPGESIIKSTITTLKGIAKHAGEEKPVYLRTAPIKDGYLIDLSDSEWRAVEVTSTGWRIVDEPVQHFIRSGTSAPFPEPVKGDVNLLWQHLNIPKKDEDLVLAAMLESWRPDTPYLVLELCGEQGSAKSSTHQNIRQLSDPNTVPLRVAPKDREDIFVAAANNHQASFENMSGLSAKMQDALCTLCTGGGYAARKLYSDADESVIAIKRPVIVNGIQAVATRPDLIDRTVHIDLPRITSYKPESELEEAFERDMPKIFGGLLDLFSKTLASLPNVSLDKPPRMADFAVLGEAMFSAMGKTESFTELYRQNRADGLHRSLESSPVAMSVLAMMESRNSWSGTMSELKEEIERNWKQDGDAWPKSPRGLSDALRRAAPALRELRVDIEWLGHSKQGNRVRIYFFTDFNNGKTRSQRSHVHPNGQNPPKKERNSLKGERVNMLNVKTGNKNKRKEGIHPSSTSSPANTEVHDMEEF